MSAEDFANCTFMKKKDDLFYFFAIPYTTTNKEKVIMKVMICRQVLIAWYAYKEERQRKARRIAHAVEQRRLRLLRSGVQQILLVSADMTLLRQKMAARQGAQVSTIASGIYL